MAATLTDMLNRTTGFYTGRAKNKSDIEEAYSGLSKEDKAF